MNILSVSRNHDASIALVRNGEVVFHTQEERHSRKKKDGVPFWTLLRSAELLSNTEHLCISATDAPVIITEPRGTQGTFYDVVLTKLLKEQTWQTSFYHDYHHLTHAAGSFYNSGFTDAVCVVFDGAGSAFNVNYMEQDVIARETHSFFTAEYPARFECVFRKVLANQSVPNGKVMINNVLSDITCDIQSFGFIFGKASELIGLGYTEAGKFMGLSAYGQADDTIPSITDPYFWDSLEHVRNGDFQKQANFAYMVQKEVQEQAINLVLHAIKITGKTNVVLSGGYVLNCTANYELLKHLPEGVKLFVEPVANDAGISLGAAKLLWHSSTRDTTVRPMKDVYYGIPPILTLPDDVTPQQACYDGVAKLIEDGNIVAIFQGRSEAGPRALGNRSILFDPRRVDGKEIINTVKGREWFRPFAGTVLEEHAHNWFDLRGMKSSPFMTYAVNVIEDKKEYIPAVVHVDGTCRVQTVNEEQNKHFYKLIESFYNRTGCPVLFNTSFNLADEPMVETVQDAIDTLRRSKIDYVYFPELGIIIKE